ncbi:MAG: transposase, partial [archaeon]
CTALEDIVVTGHKKYLDVVVLYQLLKKWKLLNLFSDFNYVVPMIINHCIDPTSKKGVTKWVKKTILPKLMNVNYDEENPFSIYRELNKLNDTF